jgi:hypothetical protein
MNALELAENLEEAAGDYSMFGKKLGYNSAAELRRLHAINAELVESFEKSQMLFTRKEKYGWWGAEMHKDEWNENNRLIQKAKQ